LRQVVLTLGHHGDVVMLGRGAQYLLPSQCALRVRVVAPLELRVDRMAARAGLPLPQAQAQVEHFDAERAAFVRSCFQRDANSPLNYDLVLNTSEISPEGAAEVVLVALRRKLSLSEPK
jgi:cytidylate kinase